MARIIVVTSGKGALARPPQRGHRYRFGQKEETVVVIFDIGLRNLDLIMGIANVVSFTIL